jgi:hypothetical protein
MLQTPFSAHCRALVPTKDCLKSPTANPSWLMINRPVEAFRDKAAKSTQLLVSNTIRLPRLRFSVLFLICKGNVTEKFEKDTAHLPPIMEAFRLNPPPMSLRPSAKSILNFLGSTLRHPSNQSSFCKGQIAWWEPLPPVATALSLNTSWPSVKTTNPWA